MSTDRKKILVIDDEDDVRLLLTARLQRGGYEVVSAGDGREGVRLFYRDRPDMVILDVAMPEMDGWQVLQRLREVSNVPVIMLTAAAQEQDKVRGLTSGADDYVTKPFSGVELLARVQAALRRAAVTTDESEGNAYRDLELIIDYAAHEVTVRGVVIELSPTEFRLLSAFAKHAGQVLSQEQLLDLAWGHEYAESLDVVRLYVGYLRRKIERDPSVPKLLETVRGFGYRYRVPTST